MASVSQTIDNFRLGVSKQPDTQLIPGQLRDIINCTPDLVEGLPKRSGSKRIGTDPLSNVQCNGTFFSYFRDETEGSYIGQVAPSGRVRMWSCKDGTEKNVWYNTDDTPYSSSNGLHTSITSYLTPSSATATEDIQALTLNDTTFLTNRTKLVKTQFDGKYIRGIQQVFATSTVNTTGNWITINDHLLETGDAVKYHHGGGTALAPLANNTVYYVIKIDSNWFRLATTKANAEGNTWIELTGTGNNAQYIEKNFVTVTKLGHGLSTGDSVDIDFTSGGATDGDYKVTSTTGSTFTITDPAAYSAITGDNDCTCKPITDKYEHKYYAYIDLLRTENGRQYSLNITNDDSSYADKSIKTATRIKISANTQDSSGGTGHCPGIGTQVFAVTAADSYGAGTTVSVKNHDGSVTYGTASGKKNLIFRITALGQQGSNPAGNFDDANISANEYICSYNNRAELLHGGEGWEEGDKITVTLDQAKTSYNFEISIEKIQTAVVKASIKAVRPEPTSFDADTAVTTDAVLGSIVSELSGVMIGSDPLGYDIIGNGIYLWSDSEFNLQVPDKDLIRVMQSEINDVSDLPTQCRDGYIVKVLNNREADEDDYYLRFVGENGRNGPGSWTECAKPGLVKGFIPSTMPHILQRQADGDFLIKENTWVDREVGDDNTNPLPTFADGLSKINKVLFFRNRLAILSGENVILSRPGELAEPSFFAKTALAVSAVDPIDISSSSTYPSDLFDGIEIPAGLVVFSTNQQFLLATDADVLNPDTAKFRSISHYNYDKNISPISLGTTIGYVDNSGGSCRFMEMQQVQREQEPIVVETSKVVKDWLPSNINHLINSPENGLVFFQSLDTGFSATSLYGFKYQDYGERKQAAWFRWRLDTGTAYDASNGGIRYSFIVDDSLYLLNSDNFLVRIYLTTGPEADDPQYFVSSSQLFEWDYFPIYLDNWATVSGGIYDSTTHKTTFTNGVNGCVFDWHNHISTASDSASSEELFLQYSEDSDPTSGSATWVTAGKIIPVNTAKPAGVNNYSVELSCPIQAKGEIAFRLYQPTNTSAETGGHMDTYGIMTLKYLKTDGTTHSTLTMSDTNNHLAKSHAVGVKATNSSASGSTGGFNTGSDYLWFSSEFDNNRADGRYVILPKINVANNFIAKIEIAAHVGNDSNGGEWPDIPNPANTGANNDDFYALGFEDIPTSSQKTYNMVQKVEDLIKGYSFKVSGDWSNATIYVGFHYGAYLEFPRFYYTQSTGESVKRDFNDYLVLHRLKLHLQDSSSITAVVNDALNNVEHYYPSPRKTNQYQLDELPYTVNDTFTVPIYKKNNTTTVYLTQTAYSGSNDVGPFNLQSITWEGDYNPKNYRRV